MTAVWTRPGPFERHLREAIVLNRERAPLYAQLSGGASRAISRTLIRYEILLLPVARWYDRRADRYHAAGVPLLEDAFVSMELTPAFRGRDAGSIEGPRLRPSGREMARAVRRALATGGFAAAAALCVSALEEVENEPRFHGMIRHTLESTLRLAELAPRHARMAAERGLGSPEGVSRALIRLHTLGFGAATRLDRRAAPLQQRGIPIIVGDVPPVPRAS